MVTYKQKSMHYGVEGDTGLYQPGDKIGPVEIVADYSRAWSHSFSKENSRYQNVSAVLLYQDPGNYWLCLNTDKSGYCVYEANEAGAITNSTYFHKAISVEECMKWIVSHVATGRLTPPRPKNYDATSCHKLPNKDYTSRVLVRLAKVVPTLTVVKYEHQPEALASFVFSHLDENDTDIASEKNWLSVTISHKKVCYVGRVPECTTEELKLYLMACWLVLVELS